MCGIAGLWRRRSAPIPTAVEGMIAAIAHRGPDSNGVWRDASAGVEFGHARLAIVDLTNEGAQPMHSACGRYVITYNGEIYNHLELREQLGAHPWRGHSDTETLLACLSRHGVAATLPMLIGMFAFAVWDRQERTLTLARDRFGEKPLYYGELDDGSLVFASELHALRAHPAWHGDIDRQALALLLQRNCIPAPWSIYRGVRKLMPGTWLRIDATGRQEQAPYWSVAEVARQTALNRQRPRPDAEATDELEALLSQAVRSQMLSDVPLGAFLSGGIDSSTIVALMVRDSSSAVRTFSIGFDIAGFNEAEQAKLVAAHLGTAHTELYVTERDALSVVPHLPTMYDEPFADSSQIPTYLVSRLAREHVTVALSGDAGDELFAGYNRYLLAARYWKSLRRLPLALRRTAAAGLQALSAGQWNALARLAVRSQSNVGEKVHKLASSVLPAADAQGLYAALASHWSDPASTVLGAELPAVPALTAWPGSDVVEAMCLADQSGYLSDDILVKVDRAAMSVALETRVPMLDVRVVEFAWSLPLSQKIRGGETKWLLRQVLARHVPRALTDRPKQGFAVPLAAWLRGPLRDWAEALLAPQRLAREGYFRPGHVEAKWRDLLAGRGNWQHHLWDVLMFQAWLEVQRP